MDKKTKRIKKRIPKQKQKQRQKVIQKVNVNVSTSGGSGGSGGSTMPSHYSSQQMMPNFIKPNEQDKNIIKSLVELLNKPQTISRKPEETFHIPHNPTHQMNYSEKQQNENFYKPHQISISEPDDSFYMPQNNLSDTEHSFFMPPDTSNLNLLERVKEEPKVKPKPILTDTEHTFFMPPDTSHLNLMERVEGADENAQNEIKKKLKEIAAKKVYETYYNNYKNLYEQLYNKPLEIKKDAHNTATWGSKYTNLGRFYNKIEQEAISKGLTDNNAIKAYVDERLQSGEVDKEIKKVKKNKKEIANLGGHI